MTPDGAPVHLIALMLLLLAALLILWSFGFDLPGLLFPALLLGLIGAGFESAGGA